LVYDLRREKMTTVAFGWGQQCCPVWSPGGEHVVFTSQSTLSWVRADGSGVMERLPSPPGTIAVPFSFSRDGRWLAFHRNAPRTGYDLWLAPVDATNGALRLGPPLPLLTQTRLQAAPAISPDGQWLAYGSDDETGRPEVYVMPFSPQGPPREGKWQVSTEGGRGPRWSPNGDTIYFRSSDDHLMAAAVFGKGNVFHSGTPRLWSTKRLANVGPQPTFDVAPDGKRIVAILDAQGPEPDETHLRVLLNVGAALLRQRVNQGTANAR